MDKEKIEEAKEILKDWKNTFETEEYLDDIAHDETDVNAIETILQYIDELEKEIEHDGKLILSMSEVARRDYIQKQKIKDRYEQLKHYDYIETRELIKLLEE